MLLLFAIRSVVVIHSGTPRTGWRFVVLMLCFTIETVLKVTVENERHCQTTLVTFSFLWKCHVSRISSRFTACTHLGFPTFHLYSLLQHSSLPGHTTITTATFSFWKLIHPMVRGRFKMTPKGRCAPKSFVSVWMFGSLFGNSPFMSNLFLKFTSEFGISLWNNFERKHWPLKKK